MSTTTTGAGAVPGAGAAASVGAGTIHGSGTAGAGAAAGAGVGTTHGDGTVGAGAAAGAGAGTTGAGPAAGAGTTGVGAATTVVTETLPLTEVDAATIIGTPLPVQAGPICAAEPQMLGQEVHLPDIEAIPQQGPDLLLLETVRLGTREIIEAELREGER